LNDGTYLSRMRKRAFEPCIPTASKKVPDRADWIHEIKQDGYRLLVRRDHDHVKLITRNGHDWTKRYPWIEEAARRIRSTQIVLDGEACSLLRKLKTKSGLG
jgi:bifunctional non-homologous end joining protein LigD